MATEPVDRRRLLVVMSEPECQSHHHQPALPRKAVWQRPGSTITYVCDDCKNKLHWWPHIFGDWEPL